MEAHAVRLVMDGAKSPDQAAALQSVIGATCLLSLVAKRLMYSEPRPRKVWAFDCWKQVAQAFLDRLLVGLSGASREPLAVDTEPYNWYWMGLIVDSTVGVLISLACLRAMQCGYRTKCVGRPDLARCGDYGDPPDFRVFLRQLGDWLALTALRRMLLALIVALFQRELSASADWLLGWLAPFPRAKFLTVLVLSPLALGVLALWVTDGFLRSDSCAGLTSDQARERLIANPGPSVQAGVATALASQFEDEDEVDRLVTFEEWKQRGISAMFGRQPSTQQQVATELGSRSSTEP